MCLTWVKASAAIFVPGILCWTGAASATPKELVDPVSRASSGWFWDVDASVAPLVNLVFIRSEGNNFFFEKDAEFKKTDALSISFTKVPGATAKNLVINDEALVNNTGSSWDSFQMIVTPSGASLAFTSSNP